MISTSTVAVQKQHHRHGSGPRDQATAAAPGGARWHGQDYIELGAHHDGEGGSDKKG